MTKSSPPSRHASRFPARTRYERPRRFDETFRGTDALGSDRRSSLRPAGPTDAAPWASEPTTRCQVKSPGRQQGRPSRRPRSIAGDLLDDKAASDLDNQLLDGQPPAKQPPAKRPAGKTPAAPPAAPPADADAPPVTEGPVLSSGDGDPLHQIGEQMRVLQRRLAALRAGRSENARTAGRDRRSFGQAGRKPGKSTKLAAVVRQPRTTTLVGQRAKIGSPAAGSRWASTRLGQAARQGKHRTAGQSRQPQARRPTRCAA